MSAADKVQKLSRSFNAFGYVAKPIDMNQLLPIVAEACNQSQRLFPGTENV